uniref:leucine-rich repeat domain-containing protein n=1 Tax=uncultured Cyclobacterium sp. TaxID=453820 RepID=UPI0030EF73FE
MDSLSLDNSKIKNLRPALKFKSITYLSLENTMIEDLSPLAEMKNLLHIHGDYSAVNNLNALQELTGLKRLSFVGTNIESVEPLKRKTFKSCELLEPLKSLPSLEYVNLDDTKVPEWNVQELASVLPNTNVIFRSQALESWWTGLNQGWKKLISDNYNLKDNPDTWALHQATASSRMEIIGANVLDLEPLLVFFNLKELIIKNVPLQDPSAISRLEMLEELQITESPFRDLNVVAPLSNLETLNVSNTAVSELDPLNSLERLKHLNLSGTNISNLKGLEMLYDLRSLDIASTGVRSLKQITHLINLESLVCFNTRLSNRNVEKFKAELPNCDVRYY